MGCARWPVFTLLMRKEPTVAAIHVLPEPEFFSTSQLREWLDKGATVLKPMSTDLHIASQELITVLSYTQSANPHFFGMDAKVRARLVGAHLRRAGEACEAANLSLLKTYLSFRQHYVGDAQPPNRRGPRRTFKFDE